MNRIVSLFLIISFVLPSFAFAKNATELSTKSSEEKKIIRFLNGIDKEQENHLRETLQKLLNHSADLLKNNSQDIIVENSETHREDVASNLELLQEQNEELKNKGFSKFINRIKKMKLRKNNIKYSNEEVLNQVEELKNDLKEKRNLKKVLIGTMKVVGFLTWTFATMLFVTTPLVKLLMVFFGSFLGLFGGLLGIYLALAITAGLVVGGLNFVLNGHPWKQDTSHQNK